jgi:hypothetical protein
VQSAIATLPWVETSSIKTDSGKKQVKFTVKEAKEFDDKAVAAALKAKGDKYASGASKLSGPTEK